MRKCIKSLISIVLMLAMLMPTAMPVTADGAYGFSDFPTGWSAPAMAHAVENGIIYGKSSDRIAPEDFLTRAEMAAIINRAFGATVKKDISKFSDVSASEWYYADIQKAYNMQTLYGDDGNTMRPDEPIIREEAIAIIARAMVLSGYSASNVDRFVDKAQIADWAVDPIASMAANGYVNGDEASRVTPKANITREEFAQLMYNIVKHYYNPNAKNETYQGNLMLNKPGISLKDITVNGDLILGDGVGTSVITLTNIDIKGRLLVRGAAQITLKNVTTGKGVVVKNVNGTVHFDNYREEKVFDGVAEHTTVTYKQKAPAGGGGGMPPVPTTAGYKVEHYQEALDGTFALYETETPTGIIGASVTAVAKVYTGFSEDASNPSRVATGTVAADGSLTLKLYYTRNTYTVTFDFAGATLDPSTPTSKTDKFGATVILPATGFTNGALNFGGWFTGPNGTGTQITQVEIGAGDTTVYAFWTSQNTYKVEHYQEALDGTYAIVSADTQILTGDAGNAVTATPKTYDGFYENTSHPSRIPNGTILANNSLVLRLYYTRNTYTFTFDVQGGTISGTPKTTYKYGETLDLPTPTKGTDTFGGWFTGANGTGTKITNASVLGTDVTSDTTVYAYWISGTPTPTATTFTVKHLFEKLDGTYEVKSERPDVNNVAGDTAVAIVPSNYSNPLAGFEYYDYSFDGTDNSGKPKADGSTVLTIRYNRLSYEVTYNFNDTTPATVHTVTLKYGEIIDTLYVPTVTVPNKYFGGWYKDAACTQSASGLETPVGGTTIYAKWSDNPTYLVRHHKEKLSGGYDVVPEYIDAAYNATVTAVAKTDADAGFEGFNYSHGDAGLTGTNDGHLEFDLYYTRKTYTISFDVDGGSVVSDVVYKYGEPFVAPSTTKQGYEVEGWYKSSTFDSASKVNAGALAGTVFEAGTLYVKWKAIPVNFTVKHYKQEIDGTYPTAPAQEETKQADTDTVVNASDYDVTFEGFTFDALNSPSVTVLGDGSAVLEIKYTRNSYDVTYNFGEAGGSHTVTLKYEEGVDLAFKPTVTVPNKYFGGWYKDAACTQPAAGLKTPVGGTTIYAQWVDNPKYIVKHHREALNGSYDSDVFVEYIQADKDATVTAVAKTDADAGFEGFNYSYGDAGSTGTNDGTLVFDLYYVRKTYNVSFNAGLGTPVSDKVYKYGEAFELPATTRPYYKVEGWYTGTNGTGTKINAGDLAGTDFFAGTLYAKWVLDWNEKVVFTANIVEEDPDNDMFSVLVDISNNPIGISSYELTLGFDNANVVAVLDGGKVVTDLNGLGGAAITTSADSITNDADAATLNSITVSWDNGNVNKAGNADLFKIRFKIINTKGDEDHENALSLRMFRMMRAVSIIPGLESLPFTLTATKVEITEDDGNKVEPEKETIDDGLAPYAIEHYKENPEGYVDNNPSIYGYTKVYTQYGYAVINGSVTAQYREEYFNQGFEKNTDHKAVCDFVDRISENGAILRLLYDRKSYEVRFDYQGATTEGIQSASVKVGSKVAPHLPLETTFEKTDWNFAGWFTEINGGGTKVDDNFTVPVNGITLYAYWTQTPYKVEHYIEELDGSYTLKDTDDLQAKAGTTVVAVAKSYLGFDAPGTMPGATVAEDGSTVIAVNYTRKTYIINYDFGDGYADGTFDNDFKYGETITLANGKNDNGKILGGWYTEADGNGTQVTDTANIDSILSTLTGNTITLYAYWVDDIGEYKVEFYQQNAEDNNYTLVAADTITGLTGAVGEFVEVDINDAGIKNKYFGFNVNDAESTLKLKLTKTGTVLKVYYDRNVYTIEYHLDGGAFVGGPYKTDFRYKQSIVIADAEKASTTTEDYYFGGWYTDVDGGGIEIIDTVNIDLVLQNYVGADNVLHLYAWWDTTPVAKARYKVEHYQENLDGTYPSTATETEPESTCTIGTVLKVSEFAKDYDGFKPDSSVNADVTVNAVGSYTLKIYYKRNVYTLKYDYSEADTEGVASNTFKYGQQITLPAENTYSKDGFIATGWYKTDAFNDSDLVDESVMIEELVADVNTSTEATIYLKWDQFFTVTFIELGNLRHSSKVYPEVRNTVPQTEIDTAYDALNNPYIVGYRKDATVSPVYAANPYEHQLFGNWYYYENGEYILFTDKTVINKDIVVRYMFRNAGLELNIPKLSQIIDPIFKLPFENDTRAIDTLKDATFLFEEKLLTAFSQLDADGKFNKANDKIVDLLAGKGFVVTPGRIFADDGEILKQHIKFNGFAYLNEAQLKTFVVKTIKETFKNDPLRMRGVIDEMMQEKDPDVIELMDDMLVSMLSGSDSARIKGIIADAVEKAITYSDDDTTAQREEKDKLRKQIKDIIVGRLDAEASPEFTGEKVVTNSVKDAVYNYFMDKENDANIRETVIDLINDAYETDENDNPVNPEVRTLVKGYITDYFRSAAGSAVFDALILELGETLDVNNPEDKPVIDLIHDVLAKDDRNTEGLTYLEELVDDVIENLDQKVGTDIYDFVVEEITTELTEDDDELETLIRAIGDAEPADLKAVLATAMENDSVFETVVKTAVSNNNVFADVIETAVSNTGVFEVMVRELCATEADFYNILVDIALSSTTLTNEVKSAVVNNDDALISVLKTVSSNASLKGEMVDEILIAADAELKGILTNPLDISSEYYADVKAQALSQAEAEIIGIIETGINEVDHPDYWPIAFAKAMEVAEANVVQDLINIGVDPNGSLWATAYADAMAQAEIDVTAELNGGITDASPYYQVAVDGAKAQAETEIVDLLDTGIAEGSEYWNVAYDTAKAILKEEIETNFNDKVDEIKTDATLNAQVKTWAQGSIGNPYMESAIKNLANGLATSTNPDDVDLKESIIDTVITTVKGAGFDTAGLASSITTELNKAANSGIKAKVVDKAITVLNEDAYAGIKTGLIADVLDEVLPDSGVAEAGKEDIVATLIDQLVLQVKSDPVLKATVISVAIDAVVYDSHVNEEAIAIINKLIDESPEANPDGTPTFKEKCITHIITYVLQTPDVRQQVMNKVVTMIETPYNPEIPGAIDYKAEAIEFAFNYLGTHPGKRSEIANKLLDSILNEVPVNGVYEQREALANDVKDIMFNSGKDIRDRILDIGFEQMFSSSDTIKEIVELALDELIADDDVRMEMILAVIETESGRDSILDILFEELERNPQFLDTMVDIAMKGKYGDMVDTFVHDLVNNGKIQINPDNRQIAEEIVLPMLDDMTFETLMSKIPSNIADVLPEGRLEEIFNKFKSKAREKLVEGIEEAKEGNSKDINVMLDHDIDVVNSILVPAYNKVFPKVVDKAEDFYYYNENQYLKAIVDMLDPEYLLDHSQPASAFGTGYRVRDSRFYYELFRNTLVLADDAGNWYLENISDAQIDNAIAKFMKAYTKVITKANSLAGGRIPEDKLNTVISYVEKAIDKRKGAYNATTAGGFERTDEVYNKIIQLVKEKIGTDLSTGTVIEVTFDGSELAVNDKDINIDNYKINVSVKGYSFKLNSREITVGGKTVDISGFVQKVADKFGTKTVTIKFCEEAPYTYSVSVGSNSAKVSAFYEG